MSRPIRKKAHMVFSFVLSTTIDSCETASHKSLVAGIAIAASVHLKSDPTTKSWLPQSGRNDLSAQSSYSLWRFAYRRRARSTSSSGSIPRITSSPRLTMQRCASPRTCRRWAFAPPSKWLAKRPARSHRAAAHDVIRALSAHCIGYHSNFHSMQPESLGVHAPAGMGRRRGRV